MRSVVLALAFSGCAAWAQQHAPGAGFGSVVNPGGVQGRTGGAGFGRMVYPGTGAPAAMHGGNRGGVFVAPPQVGHPQHGRTVVVPYPVYYGGYYYPYDAPQAPYQAGYQYDPNAGAQQPPVVIINQNFRPDVVNPVVRDYSNVDLPQPSAPPEQTLKRYDSVSQPYADQPPDSNPIVFLIAMKDRTIFAALSYWVEGDTLHYITNKGDHNKVSLDLVDREFSEKLNADRHIGFGLPDGK